MARLYPTSGPELQSKDNRFDEADTNHDGVLAREEAGKMPMLSNHFDEVDTNQGWKEDAMTAMRKNTRMAMGNKAGV